VSSHSEALALFVDRSKPERIIENWNRDEPTAPASSAFEPIELETAPN
jgi:hypothetical protein